MPSMPPGMRALPWRSARCKLSWPLDYGVPTVGEWLKMALADLQSVETTKYGNVP